MTKFDKETLHNFGSTYHALSSTDVPFSTKKQLVDDLWEKIQAEFATPPATDGSEPSTQPGPPSGTTTFRIYNKDGTVWSHNTFLTKEAAIKQLIHHYGGTDLNVSDNPYLKSYWGLKYAIREVTV